MTTFAELYDATLAVTRRPELVVQTKAAISLAVMRAHHANFFPRDEVRSPVTYTPSQTTPYNSLENIYTDFWPRLRSIHYIQNVSLDSFIVMETLEAWDQKQIKDEYNVTKRGVYTVIGTELRMYSNYPTGRADVYYFQNPLTSESSFESWIADMHPEEVAQWAAATLFSRTGYLEQAAAIIEQHIMPFKELLNASYMLSEVN